MHVWSWWNRCIGVWNLYLARPGVARASFIFLPCVEVVSSCQYHWNHLYLLCAPDCCQRCHCRKLTRGVHVNAVNGHSALANVDGLDFKACKLEALAVPWVLCGRAPDSIAANAEDTAHLENLKVEFAAKVFERSFRRGRRLVQCLAAHGRQGRVGRDGVEPYLSASPNSALTVHRVHDDDLGEVLVGQTTEHATVRGFFSTAYLRMVSVCNLKALLTFPSRRALKPSGLRYAGHELRV